MKRNYGLRLLLAVPFVCQTSGCGTLTGNAKIRQPKSVEDFWTTIVARSYESVGVSANAGRNAYYKSDKTLEPESQCRGGTIERNLDTDSQISEAGHDIELEIKRRVIESWGVNQKIVSCSTDRGVPPVTIGQEGVTLNSRYENQASVIVDLPDGGKVEEDYKLVGDWKNRWFSDAIKIKKSGGESINGTSVFSAEITDMSRDQKVRLRAEPFSYRVERRPDSVKATLFTFDRISVAVTGEDDRATEVLFRNLTVKSGQCQPLTGEVIVKFKSGETRQRKLRDFDKPPRIEILGCPFNEAP